MARKKVNSTTAPKRSPGKKRAARERHGELPGKKRVGRDGGGDSVRDIRALAEALPHIVWIAGADGAPEYVNSRWTEYTARPTVDKNDWSRVLHPEDRDGSLAAWQHALQTESLYEAEHRIQRRDGTYRWHFSRAVPLRDPGGRIVRWYGTSVDIEDQKRGQERARLRETGGQAGDEALRADNESLVQDVAERTDSLRLLRDIATAANAAQSVEEAFGYALRRVGQHFDWCCGLVYLVLPANANELALSEVFYERTAGEFAAHHQAALGARLARGVGLPGRVFAESRMLGSDDPAADWQARGLRALPAQLARALAAFPVLIGAEVVAVLEFISGRPPDWSARTLELMDSIGTQLGRVVERDRAERARRESQRLIQTISDTAPMLLHIYDLAEGQHAYVNRRFREFFGLRPDWLSAPGANLFPCGVHPDDAERYRQALERDFVELRGEEPLLWQIRVRDRHDEWRWLRNWSVVFARDGGGRPQRILGASVDVTAQQGVDEKLRQSERLASIGTLAAGIAHEINNPLASILMSAQYMLRSPPTGAAQQEMLQGVVEDTKRCARIVKSIQQFARKEPTERRPQDLNDIVLAAEELTVPLQKRHGVRVQLHLAPELPELVGNQTELEQVVWNVVANAIQASAAGKTVQIETAREGRWLRLIVRDHGLGMSREVRRHVFDPFYTTRVREGGTGLGLSIVHGIVTEHGGVVELESEPGQGTTVAVSLPAARVAEESKA